MASGDSPANVGLDSFTVRKSPEGDNGVTVTTYY